MGAAGVAFANKSSIWPFGLIAPTSGTPVPITSNIGSQRQTSATQGNPGSGRFAQKVGKLMFMPKLNNNGAIYILKPGYTTTQTNGLILYLIPGSSPVTINIDLSYGGIAPDDLYVDVDTTGDGVYITALNG